MAQPGSADKRTLLEKAWEQQPSKKPRISKQAPAVHDQVRKAITDHFKPPVWQHNDIYNVVRKDMTLFQRLTRDFTALANDEVKFKRGKKYYENLQTMYMPAADASQQMEADRTLSLSESLRDALACAEMHPPNRSPLNEWLFQTTSVNQRELVGVFRWTLKLNPAQGHPQLHIGLRVMEMCARLSLATAHPQLLKQMRTKFAEILTQVGQSQCKKPTSNTQSVSSVMSQLMSPFLSAFLGCNSPSPRQMRVDLL